MQTKSIENNQGEEKKKKKEERERDKGKSRKFFSVIKHK